MLRGILAHDSKEAFASLPDLIRDIDAAQELLNLFPSMIESLGLEEVRGNLRPILPDLSPDVRNALRGWFGSWGHDLDSERASFAAWCDPRAHDPAAALREAFVPPLKQTA